MNDDDKISKKMSNKQSNKLKKKSKKPVEYDDYKSKSQLDEENIDENSPGKDKDKDQDKDREVLNIESEASKQVRFSGVDETLVTESVTKDKDKKQDKKHRASVHDKRESLSQMSTEFDILGRAMTKMYNPIAKTTKEEYMDDDQNSFVYYQNQDQDIAKKILCKNNIYDYDHYLNILKNIVNKINPNHFFSP